MESFKKWAVPLYAVASCMSVVLVVVCLVINFCFEKPYTAGYEYFDGIKTSNNTLTSDNVGNSSILPIFEVNLQYSDTNPDLQLFEMAITEYTDYEQQSYKRYVMQSVGQFNINYHTKSNNLNPQSFGTGDFYFYEVDNNGDYVTMSYELFNDELNDLDVTSDGKSYKLQLGGEKGVYPFTYVKTETKFIFAVTHKEETKYAEYNAYDLFAHMYNYFAKNQDFEGSKVFNNLDLNRFFTIRQNENGQFYKLDDFNDNNAYFNVKYANKKINTVLTSENSIVKSIANNPNYSSGVVNTVTPYYSTSVNLTLTEYVFVKEYNNVIGKDVFVLADDYKEYLDTLNNLSVVVNINLDNINGDFQSNGIDLNTFGKINVTSLRISSAENLTFYILGSNNTIENYSFSDTLTILNSQGGVFNG